MNERISQLIKQSYVTVRSQNDRDVTYFSQEKFAELIVRECGVALSPMLRDMVSRGQAYNLIKEHFGVEE
jgi:hypothetical protein